MSLTSDILAAFIPLAGLTFTLCALVSCARGRISAKEELIQAMRGLLAAQERNPRAVAERAHAPVLVGFTPAERESFGINDTDRWIAETDRTLNEAAA